MFVYIITIKYQANNIIIKYKYIKNIFHFNNAIIHKKTLYATGDLMLNNLLHINFTNRYITLINHTLYYETIIISN